MEGLNRGIFEIFEIILAISLSFIIILAIVLTSKPNFIVAKLISSDIAYVSSITKKDSEVELNYGGLKDDFNLETQNKLIEISFNKDKVKAEKASAFDEEKIKIKKEGKTVIIS